MTHSKPPYPLNPRRALICLLIVATPLAAAETKQNVDGKKAPVDKSKAVMADMTVTEKIAPTAKERYKLPTTTESVTREKLDNTVNAMTAEDTIKYLPSIQVRKRYIGDTNAPVGWRTSGTGASARGLIYADGILLSSLLGNNNSNTGSPRWNMVSPSEIERVDVMYGPFSAAYSGNSMGGVIDITTRMPEKFEAGGDIKSTWQDYSFYGKKKTFDSQEYSFNVGDRYKDLSFRFDVSHLDSHSQPITFVNPLATTYATAAAKTAALAAATPVTGAIANTNPYGVNALVLGEGTLNHTVQDNFKWKFGYDITPTIHAAYTLGLWQNDNNAGFNSFLRNANTGAIVDSGNVKVDGNVYAASFAETRAEQMHWSHGMNLKSDTGGVFDWDLAGSVVEYGTDLSRASTQTPAQAAGNSVGRTTSLTGTGWHTADAKGIWRPGVNLLGKHEVSFGFHHDLYNLDNPVYNVTNWQTSDTGSIFSNSQGKTQTEGYWLQDAWDFNKDWNLTLGGRVENWHAYDGYNATTVGSTLKSTNQPERNELEFSPKAKLTWKPLDRVQTGLAIGQAYRFPTVTELFQSTTTTGGVVSSFFGNPNLKPEEALSSELSGEYFLDQGKLRLSLFQERVKDAIFSQTNVLAGGTTASYAQNVGETQTYGVEFAGEASDVGIQGLDLSGNATWADSRITQNGVIDAEAVAVGPTSTNPNANQPSVGKRQPRVPEWRASATIGYRPTDKLTTSVSGRYSSPQFSQLNNSDINAATYGSGGTAYFIVDLHAKYQITKQVSASAGIDNVNNQEVWLFHPFPSRTYFAELKYNY
ncbi:TonB-dependent receptor [Methylobacter sp.]|uniref:TonB-dependent receptor n=1 Tax=Methylobacter sp. TaxID=2051955 RepID=UPI00248A66A0|nr:TonB-dependent receptor [Methylobacter sp.]MDI1277655.1 TonB-dependent receptor [Methylobacter sp.]MDI1358201.1 TonB-dependent receptor [Methylobacter sp.]